MSKKNIVFIGGLGGTGKSTLVEYFHKQPLQGYSFFDFDKGRYPCPKNNKDHFERRKKQTKRWFEVAEGEYEKKKVTSIIMGLGLFPDYTLDCDEYGSFGLSSTHFAYLYCTAEVRKKRLFDRGTPTHRKEHNPWHKEYHNSFKKSNAVMFDTTNKSVEAVSKEIEEWLGGLENL